MFSLKAKPSRKVDARSEFLHALSRLDMRFVIMWQLNGSILRIWEKFLSLQTNVIRNVNG